MYPCHRGIRFLRYPAALALCAALCGCTPSGGSGGVQPGEDATDVDVSLGTDGKFSLGQASHDEVVVSEDLTDQAPALAAQRATVTIAPADVTITRRAGSSATVAVAVTMFVDSNGTAAVCSDGVLLAEAQLLLDSNGTTSVTPQVVEVPADALPWLSSGLFDLCVAVESPRAGQVDIRRFTIRYITPSDLSEFTCEQIWALPAVQSALRDLAAADRPFGLHEGTTPAQIEGTYDLIDRVTYDPDGTDDNGAVLRGNVTFANQRGGTVEREGFDASITQWIQGTGRDVSLCVLARSHHADCDQTIARLESVTVSSDGRMEGRALAVVIDRHDHQDPTCGAEGDFIYGTVQFTPLDASTNGG